MIEPAQLQLIYNFSFSEPETEIYIKAWNFSKGPYTVKKGDIIAHIVLLPQTYNLTPKRTDLNHASNESAIPEKLRKLQKPNRDPRKNPSQLNPIQDKEVERAQTTTKVTERSQSV